MSDHYERQRVSGLLQVENGRVIDSYERLRDIPAQARERAEAEHVRILTARPDQPVDDFTRNERIFWNAFTVGAFIFGAISVCHGVVVWAHCAVRATC